jgi:hypothetical protein
MPIEGVRTSTSVACHAILFLLQDQDEPQREGELKVEDADS